ncbi:BA75_01125T0 [Komagataella pastoris]|uniref:Respiratory growth induced protein 1 n=1 Tax=Komagataella pastoris TaxID=4922 RepID=A0A1B2J6M5_PICPA|nr:BA75_01125T0 [Komagataella pastoris]
MGRRKSQAAAERNLEPIKISTDSIKKRPRRDSNEPPFKKFDDLEMFETYLKGESWDNDFDFLHARLDYYPPFIRNEIHDDPEKIKPTMNNRSKKFVRNLHHHVDKHLLKQINDMVGIEYKFKREEEKLPDGRLIWRYKDESDHGFEGLDRRWAVEVDVECSPNDPTVIVDMRSIPLD